jgi:hypothetical protein
MSQHIKVEESYVDALIENAAWDAARVTITEGDKKGDKSKDKPEDKPDYTTDARKGDKGKGKAKGDKPDFTTDQRKGDKSKTHPGRKDFEKEEMKEGVEEHTCPLCESTLEEELTDEQIYEHVAQIQAALQTLEEEDEANEAVDIAGAEDEEEDKQEAEADKKMAKEAKVMKKVKELKKAAQGK